MYDRSKLHAAAAAAGIKNPNQLADWLNLPRVTAWRLWNGIGKPGDGTTDAVEAKCGLARADLILPATPAAA
jgi:hypothetical protein